MEITGNEPVMPTSITTRVPDESLSREGVKVTKLETTHYSGLTIRQQFAAMAMQGFIANGEYDISSKDEIASYAAGAADALIAELNKEATNENK